MNGRTWKENGDCRYETLEKRADAQRVEGKGGDCIKRDLVREEIRIRAKDTRNWKQLIEKAVTET